MTSTTVAGDELKSFVERYERLEAEKQDIATDQKELIAELRARGYQVKPFRIVIAQRKRDRDDLAEEEAVVDIYKSALGM